MNRGFLPGPKFDVFKALIAKELLTNGNYHQQVVVRVIEKWFPRMRCEITPKRKLFQSEQYVCRMKIFLRGTRT
jgi:hypothetical protein